MAATLTPARAAGSRPPAAGPPRPKRSRSGRYIRVLPYLLIAPAVVFELLVHVAPMLLGSGRSAVGDLGIGSIADALHLELTDVTVLAGHDGPERSDDNVRLTLRPKEKP